MNSTVAGWGGGSIGNDIIKKLIDEIKQLKEEINKSISFSKVELINKIKDVLNQYVGDDETSHSETDKLLFQYINNKEIYDLCHSFSRWYA